MITTMLSGISHTFDFNKMDFISCSKEEFEQLKIVGLVTSPATQKSELAEKLLLGQGIPKGSFCGVPIFTDSREMVPPESGYYLLDLNSCWQIAYLNDMMEIKRQHMIEQLASEAIKKEMMKNLKDWGIADA